MGGLRPRLVAKGVARLEQTDGRAGDERGLGEIRLELLERLGVERARVALVLDGQDARRGRRAVGAVNVGIALQGVPKSPSHQYPKT